MDIEVLKDTQNFGEWLEKINEIIDSLNSSNSVEGDILEILEEAKKLGQIGSYLPYAPSRNYNDYTYNCIAYIDELGENGPIDGVGFTLYSAAKSNGHITHLAISSESDSVKLYIRSKLTSKSDWLDWTLLMTRAEADDTFFPITGGEIKGSLSIDEDLTVNGNTTHKGKTLLESELRLYNPECSTIIKNDGATTKILVTSMNEPDGNPTTQNPVSIDNSKGIADINGTSEFANYLHDSGLIHEIDVPDKTKAASGLALSKLNDKLVNGYMPTTGGEFTGIVQHSADITFGWTKREGLEYSVPITVYSPTEIIFRPTNSMCVVSNTSGIDFYIDRDNEPIEENIPSTYGARTRSGISNHNPGEVVYELGAFEITEDSLSLRVRKRNVSLDSPVDEKKNMFFMFTRDNIYPSEDNTISLGTSSLRFSQVYASSDSINTSDKNLKTEISDIDDDLLDNWKNVKWKSFKFKDSVEEKGIDNARIHTGLIAQDLKSVVDSVDINEYGFFCYDKWDEQYDTDYITTYEKVEENGIVIDKPIKKAVKRKIKDAGEQYSLRYQEIQAIENAFLRREIDKLKKEIKDMKKLLDIE